MSQDAPPSPSSSTNKANGNQTWTHESERGSLWLIRLMRWIALTLGRPVARVVLHPIALYFVLAVPKARRASRQYLARALKRPPRFIDSYRHVFAFASTILDRVYLMHGRFNLFDIRIFGEAPMNALVASGSGGYMVGAHMGSFDVVRAVGHAQPNLKVALVMYEDNARKINGVLGAINPKLQQEIIPLGQLDSIMQIQKRLDEGAFVGVLADRTLSFDQAEQPMFLGAPAPFPHGPMKIAALLRRPVYLMLALYQGGNRYDVHFELIHDFAAGGKRSEAVQTAVQSFAQRLQSHCEVSPYNWFNFYDFWNPHGEPQPKT